MNIGFFEEFSRRTVHCDWIVGVKSTLGVECKGSTRAGSPMKAESHTVSSILAVVLIMTHRLGKSKILIRQNQGQTVEICYGWCSVRKDLY